MSRMSFSPRKGEVSDISCRPYFKKVKRCECGCNGKPTIIIDIETTCFRGEDECFALTRKCLKKYSAKQIIGFKKEER